MRPNNLPLAQSQSSRRLGGHVTSHKRSSFTVEDMVHLSQQERREQEAAQIAVLSCEVALRATRVGLRNHLISLREKPKTRHDFMQERKRDFRVGRKQREDPNALLMYMLQGDGDESFATHGKSPYFMLQTDPSPFVRDYQYASFEATMKQLDKKLPTFRYIEKLDLSDRLLGDERLQRLCDAIQRGCRVTHLNLAGNRIRDAGMQHLSSMIRGLHHLQQLNLARNEFTDKSLEKFFHSDCYSPTVQCLDLTFNRLGPLGAYYLGSMFDRKRITALHELRLGGRFGHSEWGDEFIKVLSSALLAGGALNRLQVLHLADAGLRTAGVDCISMLLLCDNVQLRYLNISRNAITNRKSKANFLNALRMNKSLQQLFVRETGMTTAECELAQFALKHQLPITVQQQSQLQQQQHQHQQQSEQQQRQQPASAPACLSWTDRIALAYSAAFTLNKCKHSFHNVALNFVQGLNPWQVPKPAMWTVVPPPRFDSNLFTNYASIYRYAISSKRILTAAKQLTFGRLRAASIDEVRAIVNAVATGLTATTPIATTTTAPTTTIDGSSLKTAVQASTVTAGAVAAVLGVSIGLGEFSYRRLKAIDWEMRQLEVMKEAAVLSKDMAVDPRSVIRADIPLSHDGETTAATADVNTTATITATDAAAIGSQYNATLEAGSSSSRSVVSQSTRSVASSAAGGASSKRQRIAAAVKTARRANAEPRAVKGGNQQNPQLMTAESYRIEVNIRAAAEAVERRVVVLQAAKQHMFEELHAFLFLRSTPPIDLAPLHTGTNTHTDATMLAKATNTSTSDAVEVAVAAVADDQTIGSESVSISQQSDNFDAEMQQEDDASDLQAADEEARVETATVATHIATAQRKAAPIAATATAAKNSSSRQREQQLVPERLAMAMEDCHCAMQELSCAYAALLGARYQQKLLYLCIVHEQTTNPLGKFDFGTYMQTSVPYYQNLQVAVAFVQYFFIAFPKERADHQSNAAKILQLRAEQLAASGGSTKPAEAIVREDNTGIGVGVVNMEEKPATTIAVAEQTRSPSAMAADGDTIAQLERNKR